MARPDADLLILGAGPAGMTAAQYGARANLKVLAVEQLAPGGQALEIDNLENYPGVPGGISGYDFAQILHRQAESFGARFVADGALAVRQEGGLFIATLGSGASLSAPALIIATGAKHRKLDIPGEAEFHGRGVSYCAACDGPFFRGKRILVVGGGDAACDEAQYLSRLSPHIILIHRRDRFRAQKALAERVLRNPHIEVRFHTAPREFRGEGKLRSALLETTGPGGIETATVEIDGAFICAGTVPETAGVSGLGLAADETGAIITDQRMAASLPGVFAAGDVRAAPFRQVVVAAGEGAVAAHSAAAYLEALEDEAKTAGKFGKA